MKRGILRGIGPIGLVFVMNIAFSTAWAAGQVEGEAYSKRPHIRAIEPADAKNRQLEKTFKGYLDFIIELHLLYEGQPRFHLARDGELAYDIDWMIWNQLPSRSRGLEPRLINISTDSSQSRHLYTYMQQVGLVDADADKIPVLIDTGFDGTIPNAVNALLAPKKQKVLGHMITSSHPVIPSSRVASVPFFPRLGSEEKREEYLDAVSEQVEAIENLPHYTETAADYKRTKNGFEPWSAAIASDAHKEVALKNMASAKEFSQREESLERVKTLIKILKPLMQALKSSDPLKPSMVEDIYEATKELKFTMFWPDLREAMAGGNFQVHPDRWTELWKMIPRGLPKMYDLESEEIEKLERDERRLLKSTNKRSDPDEIFIETLLEHHRIMDNPAEEARRDELRAQVRAQVKSGEFPFKGQMLKVGKKLGEGVRAKVYELGEDYIIKVPHEGNDLRYLEVEAMVARYLEEHEKKYEIPVLSVLEEGESGSYLIKKKFPRERVADKIWNGSRESFNTSQHIRLIQMYEAGKRLAAETGVGLDLKIDNLAWIKNRWVLFDTGPRTSYGPYSMTLEVPDYDSFLKLWMVDEERHNSISIESVIQKIRAGDCESVLVNGKAS